MEVSRRAPAALLIAAGLLYLALAAFMAFNKLPWCDEGWYGGPAINLIATGSMGSPNMYSLQGIREHTYWEMPGFIVASAIWLKLVGIGLVQIRALNVLLGLAAILLWVNVLRRLGFDAWVGGVTAALLAVDYMLMMEVTWARADALSLAFSMAAYAGYLRFRENRFRLALGAANTAVVLAGLTHPNAGILTLLGLGALAYRDRARLRISHAAIILAPYCAGAIAWGLYIARAPADFAAQFSRNAAGRFAGVLHPFAAIRDEIVKRYLQTFGLGAHLPGTPRLVAAKAIILLVYAIGVAYALAQPNLRRDRGVSYLLTLLGLYVLFYTFFEGTRTTYYLIWIIPVYSALVAVWLVSWWRAAGLRRISAVGLTLAMAAVQAGGTAARALQSPRMRGFKGAVAYLQTHGAVNDRTFASMEFGYALGFTPGRYTDDESLGADSGLRPAIVVAGPRYYDEIVLADANSPPMLQNSRHFLAANCALDYDQDRYQIYRCK